MIGRLRTFTLIRRGVESVVGRSSDQLDQGRSVLPAEVEALLDYKGGLEVYHRDDAWRSGVITHFGYNLRRMVRSAQARGVLVLLANPVVNLEIPPFKTEHRPGFSARDLNRFDDAWDNARSLYSKSLPAASAALKRAIQIDDEHAGIWYTLGTCQQRLNQFDDALESLNRARDLDICPLRILSPMNALIRDVAKETDTPLVDVQALIAGQSQGGITGNAWLVDHVHPSITGHKLIAAAMHDELIRLGWVPRPVEGWQAERDRLFADHLNSLDVFYYVKGEQRLKSLEGWARGRAERVRANDPLNSPMPESPPAQTEEKDMTDPPRSSLRPSQ